MYVSDFKWKSNIKYNTISDKLCPIWSDTSIGELISRILDRCFSLSSMTCWSDELLSDIIQLRWWLMRWKLPHFLKFVCIWFGLNHVLKISAYAEYRYFNQSQLLFLSLCLEWVCQSHANCPHESITHRQLVLSLSKKSKSHIILVQIC